MRIALRMNVALRTIDQRWNLEFADEVCRHEMPWVARLNTRVAGASQQQRQPADFQVGAATNQQVCAPGRRDQAGPCLEMVRVLKRSRCDCKICVFTCQLFHKRSPLRFTGENFESICTQGCDHQQQCNKSFHRRSLKQAVEKSCFSAACWPVQGCAVIFAGCKPSKM